jgi:hypothetical protein
MPTDDIAKQIVFMVRKYNERRNISEIDVLKETGYYQVHDSISEKQIYLALTQFPECIDEWIQFSEDQRSDQYYYILQKDRKYIVGFWSSRDETLNTIKTFTDKVEACANFIFSEIEYVRTLFP